VRIVPRPGLDPVGRQESGSPLGCILAVLRQGVGGATRWAISSMSRRYGRGTRIQTVQESVHSDPVRGRRCIMKRRKVSARIECTGMRTELGSTGVRDPTTDLRAGNFTAQSATDPPRQTVLALSAKVCAGSAPADGDVRAVWTETGPRQDTGATRFFGGNNCGHTFCVAAPAKSVCRGMSEEAETDDVRPLLLPTAHLTASRSKGANAAVLGTPRRVAQVRRALRQSWWRQAVSS
jgi:hypothetical protein